MDKKENIFTMFSTLTLATIQLIDFLLTWAGINILNVISEGNFLMTWLFELNFPAALIARLLMISVIILLSLKLREYSDGFNKFISIAIMLNIFIMFKHLIWINSLLFFV